VGQVEIGGHDLLKKLRKIHDTPVFMMTALDDDANEIKAFTNETDDYVTKPFTIEVLLKRTEALFRRSGVLIRTKKGAKKRRNYSHGKGR